jgi:hypothetical protein
LQVSHASEQARLQHTPPAQKPDAHAAPSLHGWPILSLHAPIASQVLAPVQVSGSSAPTTGAHTPAEPATAQLEQ